MLDGVPELRLLRYFAATAEHGSIGAAAKHLDISQPTLSHQLRRLESETGLTLFERSHTGVTLTSDGVALLAAAHHVTDAHDRLLATTADLRQHRTETIRLGLIENIPSDALTALLAALRRTAPNARIETVVQSTPDNLTAVRIAQLDGAVVRGPLRPDPSLRRTALSVHTIGALLPAAHRLASRDVVDPAELADEHLIYFPRSWAPDAYDQHRNDLAAHGVDLDQAASSHSPSQTEGFVAAGLGIALVSENWFPNDNDTVWRPLGMRLTTTYTVVTRTARRPNRAQRAICTAVNAAQSELSTM